jgi:cytochrome c-type biogenesis protein CcmH/NrfF
MQTVVIWFLSTMVIILVIGLAWMAEHRNAYLEQCIKYEREIKKLKKKLKKTKVKRQKHGK